MGLLFFLFFEKIRWASHGGFIWKVSLDKYGLHEALPQEKFKYMTRYPKQRTMKSEKFPKMVCSF